MPQRRRITTACCLKMGNLNVGNNAGVKTFMKYIQANASCRDSTSMTLELNFPK